MTSLYSITQQYFKTISMLYSTRTEVKNKLPFDTNPSQEEGLELTLKVTSRSFKLGQSLKARVLYILNN
jgi:hypothetical protein